MLLPLLDKRFSPSNSLHKIFNRSTIKVNYCYTQNLGNIIKSHNKKLISSNDQIILPFNCRKKEERPLEEKCIANNIVYKCITSATGFPNKVYLGTAQGEFKKQFHNHKSSFKNESKNNDIILAKYVWDLKLKHKCDACIEMAHFKICGTIFEHYKEVQIMPPREIRNPFIPKPR